MVLNPTGHKELKSANHYMSLENDPSLGESWDEMTSLNDILVAALQKNQVNYVQISDQQKLT